MVVKKKNTHKKKGSDSILRKESVNHSAKKKEFVKGILLMVLCTLFTSTGQIFLKAGMNKFSFDIIGLITNYQLILGCIFYGLGLILFTGALKRLDLSLAYPFLSLSFIWVAILSYMFLGETLSKFEIVGIFIVLFGVIFIGLGEKK